MAPKALKRPAAAAQPTAKKTKVSKVAAPCANIVAALRADGTSRDLMLMGMVESSIGIPRSERHAYQQEVVQMIGAALEEKATVMQRAVEEGRVQVDGAGAEKDNRLKAMMDAEGSLQALQVALEKKKSSLTEAAAKATTAAKARAATEREQKGASDAYATLMKSQKLAESTVRSCTEAIEVKSDTKSIKSIVKSAKELGVDSTLISSVSKTLTRELAVRGEFDVLVLREFGDALANIAAWKLASVAAADLVVVARTQEVDAAAATELEAAALRDAIVAAIGDAKVAVRNATADLSRAKKSVDNYIIDIKAVMDGYDENVVRLSAFQSGPLTTFAMLKDQDVQPPILVESEREAIEVSAVSESAPADAVASEAAVIEATVPETAVLETRSYEVAALETAASETASPEIGVTDVMAAEVAAAVV